MRIWSIFILCGLFTLSLSACNDTDANKTVKGSTHNVLDKTKQQLKKAADVEKDNLQKGIKASEEPETNQQ